MSEDQIKEVKKYLKIKDFYELLGIQKDAKEEQIKKAYKKLALKFHPDKNKADGSKEVFKKIAQAYDCLINADKRAAYDRYGDEEPEQHYHHYRQQYAEDISPENIFGMFFGKNNPFFQFESATTSFRTAGGGSQVFYSSFGGGGMNGDQNIFDIFNTLSGGGGGAGHTNTHRRHVNEANGRNHRHHHQDQNGSQEEVQDKRQKTHKLFSLLQLLPLFLIFFGSFFSGLLSSSSGDISMYSMQQTKQFETRRETKLLHVDYFASKAFLDKMHNEPEWIKQIERDIEVTLVNRLREECHNTEQIKRQLQIQLQAARTDNDRKYYQNKLGSLQTRSCNQLSDFQTLYNVDIDAIFT